MKQQSSVCFLSISEELNYNWIYIVTAMHPLFSMKLVDYSFFFKICFLSIQNETQMQEKYVNLEDFDKCATS